MEPDNGAAELSQPLLVQPNDAPQANRNEDQTSEVAESHDPDSEPNHLPESITNPWKNHNVRLSLLLCVVAGIADSIWTSVILSGFLYALARAMGRGSTANTLVGAAEGVEGIAQLFTALPIGYLADVWGKAKVVRLGGGLMLVAIAITLGSLVVVHHQADSSESSATRSFYVMTGALALWGVVNGISFGPSQALFSDSIPKGQRSELLTWLYTCYLLSSTVGPIVGIVLLLTISKSSEDWSLDEIYPVFFVGVCLEVPAATIMFFFSDTQVVPEEEDEESESDDNEQSGDGVNLTTALRQEQEGGSPSAQAFSKKAIPYVLFISSLIVSLGSGASVKYFPLFFKELGLSNAVVQIIFLVAPVSISGLSFVGTYMGKKLGRIETTVLFDVIGTGLLFFMTWLSKDMEHMDSTRIWTIVVVYLIRTGIMNCTYPLLESILMDSVKSNERARWKSLESIASFGWTGSALVGGILSDKHSYQFTFAITATLQLVGGLLLLVIQPFVEPELPSEETGANNEDQATHADDGLDTTPSSP